MTDYLALLELALTETGQKRSPQQPSKPPKGSFSSFGSDVSRRFSGNIFGHDQDAHVADLPPDHAAGVQTHPQEQPPKLPKGSREPDERAAVMDGTLGLDIVEGLKRLAHMPPPRDFSFRQHRWDAAVGGAHRFVENGWAVKALRLGWTPVELFGLHPTAPAVRDDCRGLALSLGGADVVDLTEHLAAIRTHSGASQTFSRRSNVAQGVVLAWMIDGQKVETT